jgi:hypothetical protein
MTDSPMADSRQFSRLSTAPPADTTKGVSTCKVETRARGATPASSKNRMMY